MQQGTAGVTSFVNRFGEHHRRCALLAKRFAINDSNLADSAALSAFCRASQEMADQAKAARALTKIYLCLDEKNRDTVQPIILSRFKDILFSAENSWRRFCDSMHFIAAPTPEIQSARSDFEMLADQFKDKLQQFVIIANRLAQSK